MKAWKETVVQFCGMITMIMLVLILTEPFLLEIDNLFARAIAVIIFGAGGIAFYIPIGMKVLELHKQIETQSSSNASEVKK